MGGSARSVERLSIISLSHHMENGTARASEKFHFIDAARRAFTFRPDVDTHLALDHMKIIPWVNFHQFIQQHKYNQPENFHAVTGCV
jgi:hypothetical protein